MSTQVVRGAGRVAVAMLLVGAAELAAPRACADEPAVPAVLWRLETASDSKGSAHVADVDGDGRLEIVFGTYFGDAKLRAVNAEDGSVLWEHASDGGPFDASVAIADLDHDGTLEVLAADSATGKLRCLEGRTGVVRWTIDLPSGTDSPPAIADLDGDGSPEIVVGTMWRPAGRGNRPLGGFVCAYRAKDRALVWQQEVAGCVQSEPCVSDVDGDGDLDVVVTSWRGDDGIHAFDGRTGGRLWKVETEKVGDSPGMYHGVAAIPTRAGTLTVAATCAGGLYGIDGAGKVAWHRTIPHEYLFAPPTAADLDGDGAVEVVIGGRACLFAIDAATGRERWRVDLEHAIDRRSAAIDLDGDGACELVYAEGTCIVVREGATGKERWRHQAKVRGAAWEEISSGPVLADFDGDGALDLFFVVGSGTSGDEQAKNFGVAIALRVGKAGSAGPSWPTFRGNLRRTGTAPRRTY